jgi:type VI secretion system protein ImpH
VSEHSNRRGALRQTPASFGFLALLREIERENPGKPRIGRNTTLAEETVRLGQDPFLAFPDANISSYQEREGRAPRLLTRFLGYFGPQGALPLNIAGEVMQWHVHYRDDAFPRFADIFAARFQELFFRSWSDARAITQFDHEAEDRFRIYVGAFQGLATPAFEGRGPVSDLARLAVTGLIMGRVKSPVRLRQMLEVLLDLPVTVEEHVPVWLTFEPSDHSLLGSQAVRLGYDCRLGARVQGVNEKIHVRIKTGSLAEFESFLPGGIGFARLCDLLFRYLGHEVDVDILPALPSHCVKGIQLGGAAHGAALGWTAWLAPSEGGERDWTSDAIFSATARHGQDKFQ